MDYRQIFESLQNLLHEEFCRKYGDIVSKDVVADFLSRIDDFRMVTEKYVDYLYDYVMDFNLWG